MLYQPGVGVAVGVTVGVAVAVGVAVGVTVAVGRGVEVARGVDVGPAVGEILGYGVGNGNSEPAESSATRFGIPGDCIKKLFRPLNDLRVSDLKRAPLSWIDDQLG